MRRRVGVTVLCATGCLLIVVGVAAADRCHTPLPGTRSLTLHAGVTGYGFSGDRVLVRWSRAAHCSGTLVWNYTSAKHVKAATPCGRGLGSTSTNVAEKLVASDRRHVVRVLLAASSSDSADRLIVRDRNENRLIASWPLIERPARVALWGDIAILSGARRQALYALRLTDGRIAQIGITRAADQPQVGPAGVLYQTDLDRKKHRTAPTERTLNLLPLASVRAELSRPFTTVRKYMSYSRPATTAARPRPAVSGRSSYIGADPPRPFKSSAISAIAMDGARVALAVRDPSGRCDYVLFWNVGWHYVTRLTRSRGPTCLPAHAPGGITNVAIAGSRAVWTVSYGNTTRVIAAAITDCQEWVVARPAAAAQRVTSLAGDEGVLAYALSPGQAADRTVASVGVVPQFWQGVAIQQLRNKVLALSVFDGDVAALDAHGTVSITTRAGAVQGHIETGGSRAIALRRSVLAALTDGGRLDVYSRDGGRRLHTWPVPANAASLDVHYNTALLTAGRDVYAMNLRTGRIKHLFRAPSRVAAQIEAPGAAIHFNRAGRGHVRFVPMSRIEASTR